MGAWQLHPEEVVAQRYRVVEALGRRRYRVRALSSARELVLTQVELPDPQAVSRFDLEASRLCTLRHPALAAYVDQLFIERDGSYWGMLLQELAPGVSLARWFESGAAPSEERSIQLAEQVLEGLAYLHEQRPPVLHGKLCLDSVVLDDARGVRLVAYGDIERLEGTGQVRGALGFTAPEETRGHKAPASDLYAVGALLVSLLVRRSPAELTQRSGSIDLRSVKVSRWLSAVLARLLHPDPNRRFPSARSVRLALERKSTPISVKRMAVLFVVLTLVVGLPSVGVAWYLARPAPKALPRMANGQVKLPPRLPPIGPHVVSRRSYSGHLGAITNLAWLPDNEHFISSGYDGAIKLWHKDHEQPLRSFSGQQGPVFALALDPQGKMLAAGGREGQLRVWSLETGKVLQNIAESPGGVHDLEFSDDGAWLASTGNNGIARIRRVETFEVERTFTLGAPGLAIAFSPDGKLFATTCNAPPDITVWDRTTGVEQFKLAHGSKVSDMRFTADGAGLISAGDDKRVLVWNVAQRNPRHELTAHRDEAWKVALNERAGLLATGGKGPLLVISDPFKGRVLEANRVAPLGFPALAFSPDGNYLIGGGANQKIWLFHAEKSPWFPKPIHAPPLAQRFVPPVGASPLEAILAEAVYELRERPDGRGVSRAERLLAKAEALDPDHPMVLELGARIAQSRAYQVGDKYESSGLVRARALADKASALAPRNADVWRRVAYVAMAQKKLPDAVAAAAKARRLDPDSVWQRRLELEIAQKDGSDQDRQFELARGLLEADPTDTYGLSALIDIYKDRGEWDAAEQVYKSLLALQSSSAWTHGNLASFYVDRRRPREAQDEAKTALAIMNYGVAHRILGDALLEQAHQDLRAGKPRDEVEKLIEEAKQQRASASRVFFVSGLLAWSDGEIEDARDFFKRAVKADKHYAEAQDALTWQP